jgi:hypothetical protein
MSPERLAGSYICLAGGKTARGELRNAAPAASIFDLPRQLSGSDDKSALGEFSAALATKLQSRLTKKPGDPVVMHRISTSPVYF